MKFYKESDVQVLINAIKRADEILHDPVCSSQKALILWHPSFKALEAFAKIDPVSVPNTSSAELSSAFYVTHNRPDLFVGAQWENDRIRKIMEGESK